MSTTVKQESQRSMESRLAETGRKIDRIAARTRTNQQAVRATVSRRVDALRAQQAEAYTQLREMYEADEAAWEDYFTELDRDLDELDIELAITEAQLDADLATDEAAFAAAVQAELDAWSVQIDALQAKAATAEQGVRDRTEAAVKPLRESRAAAARKLTEFRQTSSAASETLRVGVEQAMDDLDRTAYDARMTFN